MTHDTNWAATTSEEAIFENGFGTALRYADVQGHDAEGPAHSQEIGAGQAALLSQPWDMPTFSIRHIEFLAEATLVKFQSEPAAEISCDEIPTSLAELLDFIDRDSSEAVDYKT